MKFWVFVRSPSKVSGTRPFSCPSTLREFAMTLATSAVRVAEVAVVGPLIMVERTQMGDGPGFMGTGLSLALDASVVGR